MSSARHNPKLPARPLVYLITRGNLTASNYDLESANTLSIIRTAVRSGVALIQIREKRLPARLVFELTAAAVALNTGGVSRILVNERPDIALAAGAGGVHLTSDAVPAGAVRRSVPEEFLIGVSVHTPEEAARAARGGADLVTYGPVFRPISKPPAGEPKGLGKLSEVCRALDPFPVIALGGIDRTNFRQTLAAGAYGFAGIGYLNDGENLREAARAVRGERR